jgi:hypothetical protein
LKKSTLELTCKPITCGPSTIPATSSATTTGTTIPARLANVGRVAASATAAMIARNLSGEIEVIGACISVSETIPQPP